MAVTVTPIIAARLATGSWFAVGFALMAWGLSGRRAWLLVGLLLVIGGRADSAIEALVPAPTQPLAAAELNVVDDPRTNDFGLWFVAEFDDKRVVVRSPFGGLVELANLSSGDRVVVSGSLRGQTPDSSWEIGRRITGMVSVSEVHDVQPASGATGAATSLRELIRSGADSMSPARRALFTGLVFGDDRDQDVIVADNFRAAGLGHLLAVSGQNVVFVLLLAAPLLSRIRSVPARTLLAIAVLVGFGFVTRFEPSVLRAIVMAALVIVAVNIGRPASAGQVLPAAVTGLLVIDPLLAWSLAFQLSVLATLGLVVGVRPISAQLRGPELFRSAIAATIAAQLFVAPLLLSTFGFVSAVAVPANLLAAPAAAGVMMWGLIVGPIAGLAPEPVAIVAHLPTRALLAYLDTVAAGAARIDVGNITLLHVGVAVVGWFVATRWRRLGWLLIVLSTASVVVAPAPLASGVHSLTPGIEVARSDAGYDVMILDGPVSAADALAAVRTARLGRIDLLIARDGGRRSGRVVSVLAQRFEIAEVWAPPNHQVPGARSVERFDGVVGDLSIVGEPGGQVVVGLSCEAWLS